MSVFSLNVDIWFKGRELLHKGSQNILLSTETPLVSGISFPSSKPMLLNQQ